MLWLSQEGCSRATKRIWRQHSLSFWGTKREMNCGKKNCFDKGKILCFPPLIVPWLMRCAKFTCLCSAVLCLSMLLNSTGWKKYPIYRNCPHKCDETYLGLVSDRQVRANLLRSGRLNLEDPFMKTSFESRCLARGNYTPTDLCVSAGVKRKVAEGQASECLTCF